MTSRDDKARMILTAWGEPKDSTVELALAYVAVDALTEPQR